MHSHLNSSTFKSKRLIIAVLFSLALHALLLFFIKFSQPFSKNPARQTISLNVVLEKKAIEVSKPAGIPEASRESKGSARTGVQETNHFPQKILTAIAHAEIDQPKMKIPKKFRGKKILTINKPAKIILAENEPDLLVTHPPEATEIEEKPFAPTPSVENPVEKVILPIEKLVSPKPTPGVKQEKIVFAEPAQEKSGIEKPESSVEEPKPVKIEELAPVKIVEPKPVKIEEPKPVKVAESAKAEEAKPVKTEEAKSVKAEEAKPVKAEEAKPAKVEEAKPVKTEEAGSAEEPKQTLAESKSRPSEYGKSDVFRAKPPGYAMPSLAELSIAAVRNLPREENKKIQFGERRKTVGLKEQDFRYAMYVEGVRIKLQRIGSFNYPAAAKNGGTLSVKITIRSDGSMEDFSIVRPSEQEALNAGAERIVRMSAPFSPLPENIRRDTDILIITINWTFFNSSQSFD